MERFCDLHTHSTFSDGTCTPAEILSLAQQAKLCAVALCDHNTVAGLADFMEAAKQYDVEPIPGVEFSADYRGGEVHILGLFIRPEYYGKVTELLDDMLQKKEKSNLDLVDALRAAQIHLDYAKIKAGTPGGQVNRAVIAAEMVREGYCKTVKEAFSQWLSPKRGFYRPPERPDAFYVIRFIKSIGAAAVLAHPFLNLDETSLRAFLQEAKGSGLDGMEVYYPLFDQEKTTLAQKIAKEFGLYESGGSDFHGDNKPDIAIGTGKGNLAVQEKILNQLRMCTQ